MSQSAGEGALIVTSEQVTHRLLLDLLDGATFANALRRNGKHCRIRLPSDTESQRALLDAHLRGAAGELTFIADGHGPWAECVDAVVLAAFCPGHDGRYRWVAIDLDADDHGERGLADPVHAVRSIAERADHAGLLSGLFVASSRGGRGRHVFLIPPEPVELNEAVIAVAALVASAFRIAVRDVSEYEGPHAFRTASGAIANPGDAGAIEFVPRSTTRPPHGWALTLPASGAFRDGGGGVLLDPFEDEPVELQSVPRCHPKAWSTLVAEARAVLVERTGTHVPRYRSQSAHRTNTMRNPIDGIDPRSRDFLEGATPDGDRNNAAFAASVNLLGCGVDRHEARDMILKGASTCGLPEREAIAAFESAQRTINQKRRLG